MAHHVDFDATYCWPKPVQKPHPQIYFGGFTAATVSRARRHHAGWMPMAVPVADMVPAQMSLLDGATDIPVSVIVPEAAEPALLDAYRQHGAATRVLPAFHQTRIGNSPTARQHCGAHRNIQLTAARCTPPALCHISAGHTWADRANMPNA